MVDPIAVAQKKAGLAAYAAHFGVKLGGDDYPLYENIGNARRPGQQLD